MAQGQTGAGGGAGTWGPDEARTVLIEQLQKNSRPYAVNGVMTGRMDTYVLKVLPADLLAVLRHVAVTEISGQVSIGNKPSQIIVDGASVSRRGIDRAMRYVKARFQDTNALIRAIRQVYDLLQHITRLQNPAQNSVVARTQFYLWLNGVNLGVMPLALSRITPRGVLDTDSVVRIVGPLVPYGRKLFWNPVGASTKMNFYRTASKRSGVRFLPLRGSSANAPRFKPWSMRTLRRKANLRGKGRGAAAAEVLSRMLTGATPPGRIENTMEIVKRVMRRKQEFRGLHFSDGWVEYAPAIGWSKLRDPRVPSFGVMFDRKGKISSNSRLGPMQ